jgi:DNA gyrase/topoisomerase IV subunit A
MNLKLKTMTILYGVLVNILWVISLIREVKLFNQINDIQKENTQLKDKISNLEKNVRDEANKNIILESLLKQRPNQNEDRRIY